MVSITIYSTGRQFTTDLIFSFAEGLRSLDGLTVDCVDIQEFKEHGLRPGTDCVVVLGILRGTGLVYHECIRRNIELFYIDHAYFNPGYERGWLRVTKNQHAISSIQPCDPDRWNQYFSTENGLGEWGGFRAGRDTILVLPPTHAVAWMFDAHNWLEQTLNEIKRYSDRPIVVRKKPSEPHVDDRGELIGMVTNPSSDTSLEEDMKRAYCVFAYNSNTTILATRMGIPVIAAPLNPCFPISYSCDQLETEAMFVEPRREELFHWLAWNQFHIEELQNGMGWQRSFSTDQPDHQA